MIALALIGGTAEPVAKATGAVVLIGARGALEVNGVLLKCGHGPWTT